jgi:hypothetical protein
MQTAMNLRPAVALPGTPFDINYMANDVLTFIASAIIPYGVAVELNSNGTIQPAQTTTTGAPPAKLVGVSVYDALREQNYPPGAITPAYSTGYQVGEAVPVMTRGRIYVAYDGGGTWTNQGTLNVWHSSTGANPQGVFTFSATSITAGAEIDNAPAWCTALKPISISPQAFTGSFPDGFGQSITVGLVSLNWNGKY